jgi:hypothetical protein
VQVWRLSNLELLNTVALPKIAGDSAHRYPFELRSTDGETVMLNSYYCGFYRLTGLDKKPAIERTGSFNDIGCAVPYTIGKMMVMPVAYGHRIATLDMTNPDKPVEKSSLAVDSTFFPHWVSGDRGTNRIVVTDQGDGVPRVMIGIVNTSTGFITWDDKFRDAGSTKPGVSLAEVNWPNGVKGKVMAHGALFIK